MSGRASAARGWLARAERVLDGIPTCAGHGWVAVERARQAATADESAQDAQRALELAREYGDDDEASPRAALPERSCGDP